MEMSVCGLKNISKRMLTHRSCLLLQQLLIRLSFRQLTDAALQVKAMLGYTLVNNMGVNG